LNGASLEIDIAISGIIHDEPHLADGAQWSEI